MRICRRCLYPENHPLGINFDDKGVCSGCRVHEEKDNIDWMSRQLRLENILEKFRNRNYGRYDCIVPISGGRDSFYIVHLVKKVYRLNPLLVVYNKYYNTRAGIYNISRLRTAFGCDIATLTLDPRLIKRIMRATLALRGSFHWHALAGHTVFPVQTAVRMKIPLIIWGAHQGLEQVGMYSHLDEVEMTRRYRKEHDLLSLEAEDFIDQHGLCESNLSPFFYPTDKQLREVGVVGIYLGNFHRWDTKVQHEEMVSLYHQYQGQLPRTFDRYNDIDDMHFTGAHDLLKIRKFGYGKIVDDVCREIRYGRLARDEAITLVAHYESQPAPNIDALVEFIGMPINEILNSANRWRDSRLHSVDFSYSSLSQSGGLATVTGGINFQYSSYQPDDFVGEPLAMQLLTRGYARE